MKSMKTMKKLMDTLFEEWGVEAILPSGESIRVLFQAKDQAYGVSHSELIATTGLMEVRAGDCVASHLTPAVGLVLRIHDQAFRVIGEPRWDAVSDSWQCSVMAQANPVNDKRPVHGKERR